MSHSTSRGSIQKPGRIGNYIRILAGCLIAAGCLFWVFHNIQPAQFFAAMAHVQWWLWSLCILLQFLAYFCVAWEWKLLLRPTGPISLRRTVQAVFAGRFANDALPLQLGYLVRAMLAARWMGVSVISVFPSLIVERLWDGFWLAAGIGAVTFLLPLPVAVLRAATFLGTMVIAGTVATVFIALRRRRTTARETEVISGGKIMGRIQRTFWRLVDGVRDIVRSGLLAPILGLSLLKIGIQAAAFLGFLRAYHLDLSLPAGLAVFLLGYLAICVPSTSAGTGVFQLFVVAGLTLFGITKSVAAGFALVVFISITVPLAIAGFFALARTGLRLRQVQSEAGQFKARA